VQEGTGERVTDYRVIARYRRTVSAVPAMKRLVPVATLADKPIPFGKELGELCPDVLFNLLEDRAGARYWGKRWLGEREPLLAPTLEIERFLATLDDPGFSLAVDVSPEFGLIYRFDDRLFDSRAIIHQWERDLYFNANERRTIERVASIAVDWLGLPSVPLGELTDFQVCRVPGRLVFLDFEPSAPYAASLAGVVI
jgi:hypothetical protein